MKGKKIIKLPKKKRWCGLIGETTRAATSKLKKT
jgi:hypothetical protein